MTYCWIIPHYNHAAEFRNYLLPRLAQSSLPCIVVDDGSDASNLEQLKKAIAEHSSITLVQHENNRGKGAAVLSGCQHARTEGYTHVIQIDADGQHSEWYWRREFAGAYQWLFGSTDFTAAKNTDVPKIRLFPNPTNGQISVENFFTPPKVSAQNITKREQIPCGMLLKPAMEQL